MLNGGNKEAVEAVHQAIFDIINAKIDNETMRAALEVLGNACKVEHCTIAHNVITMGAPAPEQKEQQT